MSRVDRVVIELHGFRRIHQYQKPIVCEMMRKMTPDLDHEQNKELFLEIAQSIESHITKTLGGLWYKDWLDQSLQNPFHSRDLHKVVMAKMRENDLKPVKANHRNWCDIPDCEMSDDTIVVRALSRRFDVETKKCCMSSHIVLDEAPLADFGSEEEAIEFIRSRAAEPKRPLILEMLHKIKRPLEHDYTEEEVFEAMFAYIIKLSRMYCTSNFPEEDGIQQGYFGIKATLRTDRAIAPFSKHSFRHIQTNIRRAASTCGTIRHGERDQDFHGKKGVIVGHDEEGNSVYNRVQSADIVIGDESVNLYDLADQRSNFMENQPLDPQNVVVDNESKDQNESFVTDLIRSSDFTSQQLKVICLKFGINRHIENPYDPKSQSDKHQRWLNLGWEHTGTEIAKIMGCTRQRIGQQISRCLKKLTSAAVSIEQPGIEKPKLANPEIVNRSIRKIEKERPIWTGKRFIKLRR